MTEFHWFWGLALVWSVVFLAFWAWRWTEGKIPTWGLGCAALQAVFLVLISVYATSPALWPTGAF
jgi:hypothetical protein